MQNLVFIVKYQGEEKNLVINIGNDRGDPLRESLRQGSTEFLDLSKFLFRYARKGGDTVVDIGANIGCASLPFAIFGYRVHAFEAGPENCAVLKENSSLNGLTDYIIHNVAVSDTGGVIRFIDNGCHGHVDYGEESLAFKHDFGNKTKEIPCVRIDEYFHGIVGNISIIKIDIEGYEVKALNGMSDFLRRHDYPPLYVEVNGYCLCARGYTPSDVIGVLEGMGYSSFLQDRSGAVIRRTATDLQAWHNFDYVFLYGEDEKVAEPYVHDYRATFDEEVHNLFKYSFPEGNFDAEAQKIYTAFMLERLPEYHEDPRIASGLDRLAEDANPAVRNAAAWWRRRSS